VIHYSGLFICVIVAILYSKFEIGLRGLWTTRTIIIITLLTGVFFLFIAARSVINTIEKLYFKVFSLLPILTAVITLIPFLGIVIVLSLWGQLTNPADKIFYEDGKLRVQSTFLGILGTPRVDIFEKEMFFEKHIKRADFPAINVDSIKVSYDSDSTRIIAYGLYNYDDKRKGKTEILSFTRIK